MRILFLLSLLLISSLIVPNASASHSVSADPAGGTYNSTQSVTLTATENSTIYYTTDGLEPNSSSAVYASPLDIATNSTLKFFGAALLDNHTTAVITEVYNIESSSPEIVATDPEDGQKGVDVNTVISVTFSEAMDDSTINFDTFVVENREHLQYFGEVSFDPAANTATFVPDFLDEANHYVVTLKADIKDLQGNSLREDNEFTFATGPDMSLRLFQHDPTKVLSLLGGGTFTITPNPFTLSGSLTVEDNQLPDTDPNDGSIFLNNIEFGTYIVSQTGVPAGFGNIFDNVTITAHDTSLLPRAEFRNRNLSIPVTDFPPAIFVGIPPPDLTSEQFDLYKDAVQVGVFLGFEGGLTGTRPIDTVGPGEIPGGTLETSVTLETPETTLESVLFKINAAPGTSAQDLFTSFKIPTYPDIDPSITNDTFYFVPAFIIPYGETGNNFMLTPTIGHVRPGMSLVLEQPSYIASEEAKVERVNMTLNSAGNDVGFSFAITDERPPGTPEPPLDVKALFLDIDFVGNIDFSTPAAFESSPIIDILVNKTLHGFDQLPDGCVNFRLLLFNERTGEWDTLSQLRDPTRDTSTQCGFTLFPEHFSKFAVGGVKGQTVVTEEHITHGGGGGHSRSTAITQTPTGRDVEAAISTQSGTVSVHFESVNEGSGQLKINANELSVFQQYFDELGFLSQDNDEHGMAHIDGSTYSTAGDVFDIDASLVKYEGTVDVTIPYDEDTVTHFGSESNVRFLHYNSELGVWEDNTASVDEIANTVTGTLDSLSPVTAAIIIDQGGNISSPQLQPSSQLGIYVPPIAVSVGGQAIVSTDLSNNQTRDQNYVMIVQVVDDQNIVQSIDWQSGSLKSNQNSLISMNLNQMQKGTYTVHVLLLSDFENPWLLSPAVKTQLQI